PPPTPARPAPHLGKGGGGAPAHPLPHRGRLEHPPDRHHVGGREAGRTARAARGPRRPPRPAPGGPPRAPARGPRARPAVARAWAAVAVRAGPGPARVAQERPAPDLAGDVALGLEHRQGAPARGAGGTEVGRQLGLGRPPWRWSPAR